MDALLFSMGLVQRLVFLWMRLHALQAQPRQQQGAVQLMRTLGQRFAQHRGEGGEQRVHGRGQLQCILAGAQCLQIGCQSLIDRVFAPAQLAAFTTDGGSFAAVQRAGQHIAHAGGQVVRLVNQQRGRASSLEDAPQRYQRVKGVVVIADDHIGRFTQQE